MTIEFPFIAIQIPIQHPVVSGQFYSNSKRNRDDSRILNVAQPFDVQTSCVVSLGFAAGNHMTADKEKEAGLHSPATELGRGMR